MDLIMNGLLMAGTLFAGAYCWVLGRRVRDLKSLDSGLGAGIVTLTRQIELARATLEEAQAGAKENRAELERLVAQADTVAGRLKLMMAATRDSDRPRTEAEPAPRRTILSAPPRHRPTDAEDDAPRPRPSLASTLPPRPSAVKSAAVQPPEEEAPEAPAPARPSDETPRVWPSLRSAPETAEPEEDVRPAVPKPRLNLAPGGVLRQPMVTTARPANEDELMDALSALAAGTGR